MLSATHADYFHQWVFTLGLSLSSALDVMIAAAMCYYLQQSRTGFEGMDHIIDILLFYTFNNVSTLRVFICSKSPMMYTAGRFDQYCYYRHSDLLAFHANQLGVLRHPLLYSEACVVSRSSFAIA